MESSLTGLSAWLLSIQYILPPYVQITCKHIIKIKSVTFIKAVIQILKNNFLDSLEIVKRQTIYWISALLVMFQVMQIAAEMP